MLSEDDEENREADASAGRFVRYQFTPAFLKLRTVGATWVTHSRQQKKKENPRLACAQTITSASALSQSSKSNATVLLHKRTTRDCDVQSDYSLCVFPPWPNPIIVWNSPLETDPSTTFAWSRDTTFAITCWRASTLTLASASRTAETPASTSTSSLSYLKAWVSHIPFPGDSC